VTEVVRQYKTRQLFHEHDSGFTMVGMLIALLLTLALIGSSVQIYRIMSVSAAIQDIADQAALAAQGQVASFYTVSYVCDACLFSLSLTGLMSTGLGLICLCVPPVTAQGHAFLQAGRHVLTARDRCAHRCGVVLNRIQQLLPFFAAAQALRVAHENGSADGVSYRGIALLIPSQGEPINAEHESSKELCDDIDAAAPGIEDAAAQAEEEAQAAREYCRRAFNADCGNHPSYCLHERALHLAGMTGLANPYYAAIDTWSFSVPLERSRAYYRERAQRESETESAQVEERMRSALRLHFYRLADEQLRGAYVHDIPNGAFDAYFPLLPRNTDEMRQSNLYHRPFFPLTCDEEGHEILHASDDCPIARNAIRHASVAHMEAHHLAECPYCKFSASDFGKVGAASTSIENGYEYHYAIVAEEADNYRRARERMRPAIEKVQGPVQGFLDRLSEAMGKAGEARLNPRPPGRAGAIVLMMAHGGNLPDRRLSSFSNNDQPLSSRCALSAATLSADTSSEMRNVINDILGESFSMDGLGLSSAAGTLGHIWSGILVGYGDAHASVKGGMREALSRIPLLSASGLGQWAADTFDTMIEDLGLRPVELTTWKPVIVNSIHVGEAGDEAYARFVVDTKRRYARLPSEAATGSLLDALIGLGINQVSRQSSEKSSFESMNITWQKVLETVSINGAP
jgi:competence protein ComGC